MSDSQRQYRNLKKIRAALSSVKEGHALLQFSKASGYKIRYAEKGELGPNENGLMRAKNLEVILNPALKLPSQVSGTCHELYHVVQHVKLLPVKRANVQLQMGLTRFQEGLTFVFQEKLGMKINEATGLGIPPLFPNKVQAWEDVRDWEKMFTLFQRSSAAEGYDSLILSNNEAVAARINMDSYRAAFNVSSFDAAGDLRRIAGTGMAAHAPYYLPYKNSHEIIEAMLSYVKPDILARARLLNPV